MYYLQRHGRLLCRQVNYRHPHPRDMWLTPQQIAGSNTYRDIITTPYRWWFRRRAQRFQQRHYPAAPDITVCRGHYPRW